MTEAGGGLGQPRKAPYAGAIVFHRSDGDLDARGRAQLILVENSMSGVGPILDRLPTSVRSALATFVQDVKPGRFAIYAGAGVDCALAEDAQNPRPPLWHELLIELKAFGEIRSNHRLTKAQTAAMRQTAQEWPTEIATAAAARLTNDGLCRELDVRLNPAKVLPKAVPGSFTDGFCRLAERAGLVVTTNYSDWIVRTLRTNLPSGRVRLVHREELQSRSVEDLTIGSRGNIYIVHLHGRAASNSKPVFDVWGYSLARDDDPIYYQWLQALFATRSVLSLGTSWSDHPLRSAAARAERLGRYSRRKHLWLRVERRRSVIRRTCAPTSPERVLSRSIRAAYGVEPIWVSSDEQAPVLTHLLSDANWPEPPRLRNVSDPSYLSSVATFLEQSGDYESTQQEQWFGQTGNVSKVVARLANGLIALVERDPHLWQLAARIERHLRHQLWLYRRPEDPGQRARLWRAVLAAFYRMGEDADRIAHHVLLDLSLGLHEIGDEGVPPDVTKRLLKTSQGLSKPRRRRVALAGWIWPSKTSSTPPERGGRLSVRLLDEGWEAMAVKVALDEVDTLARRELPFDQYRKVVEGAERAAGLARLAGTLRREIKADVLAAIWSPDLSQGYQRLLSRLRAIEHRAVEQPLIDGIATGLTVCMNVQRRQFLEQRLAEVGIRWDQLDLRNIKCYWLHRVPPERRRSVESTLLGVS